MIKKLTKVGNGYALYMDRNILELLNITPETPLKISTNGRSFTVEPATNEISPSELDESLERFNVKFGRMMKRLAE